MLSGRPEGWAKAFNQAYGEFKEAAPVAEQGITDDDAESELQRGRLVRAANQGQVAIRYKTVS